jgi:hypothetical protein
MASSQQQFNDDKEVPINVLNIILEYDEYYDKDLDQLPGYASAPLASTLFNSMKKRKERDVAALVTAAVNHNLYDAKKLLESNGSLGLEQLSKEVVVVSDTHHKFSGLSPYQAALAVDDMRMANLIKSYSDQKEADRQYDEQRLNEVEDAKKWEPIHRQLDTLLCAIRDCKREDIILSGSPDFILTVRTESPVQKELAKFYQLLDATLEDIITPGKRQFDPDLFLMGLRLCDKEIRDSRTKYRGGNNYFADYSSHLSIEELELARGDDTVEQPARFMFFAQKVLGYEGLARYMPVNMLLAHQDLRGAAAILGRGGDADENSPQLRNTEFRIVSNMSIHAGKANIYPIRPRGTENLNYMICDGGTLKQRYFGISESRDFQHFYQSTIAARERLMPPQNRRGCIMM